MHWDQPRPPVSLLLMTQIAEEYGVPARDCLEGTWLTSERLLDPSTEVTPRDDLAVARNLVSAVPDGHPGLRMGHRFRLGEQGIYGFALLSSPTLRVAVDVGLRFLDLAFGMATVSAESDTNGDLVLHVDTPDLPPTVRRFYVERDVASIVSISRVIAPGFDAIADVQFAFPSPAGGEQEYRDILGLEPGFDAQRSAVTIAANSLDAPLPGANPHTAAEALEQCRKILESRQSRTGVAGRVRDELLGHIDAPPPLDDVAAALNVSGRTLRKKLTAEGTSYRALLDEVREHLAEEMLLTGAVTVENISRRLGYLEVSSFSQAFRRWKGVGPREFRSAYREGQQGA